MCSLRTGPIWGFLLILITCACLVSLPVSSRAGTTVDTVLQENVDFSGLGAEQREKVKSAVTLIEGKRIAEAEALLQEVLATFRKKMTDDSRQYVCTASTKQFAAFRADKARTTAQSVIRVSYSYAKALHLMAFIAAGRKEWDPALAYLDQAIRIAPYGCPGFNERGYILNQQAKHQEAIAAYRACLDLAARHHYGATMQAAAWRGIGWAQVEIGQLDEAKKSYQQSLKKEPGNKIALYELDYIQRVQANQAGAK